MSAMALRANARRSYSERESEMLFGDALIDIMHRSAPHRNVIRNTANQCHSSGKGESCDYFEFAAGRPRGHDGFNEVALHCTHTHLICNARVDSSRGIYVRIRAILVLGSVGQEASIYDGSVVHELDAAAQT